MKETALLMGEEGRLFGICSEAAGPSRIGAIILNAGLLHHVGPYRLHVTLGRALAGVGCPTIRLDQSGKGESPLRAGHSSDEALLRDYDDCCDELRGRGVDRVILIGLCSGADDALFIAERRPGVAGLVLLDGFAARTRKYYLNHYRPRIFKLGPWHRALTRLIRGLSRDKVAGETYSMIEIRNWLTAKEMLASYRGALGSGTKVLTVFTRGAADYYNYQGQLADSLGIKSGEGRLLEVYYPDSDHTFPIVDHRERLVSEITNWVRSAVPT